MALVSIGTRHDIGMVEPDGKKECRQTIEDKTPRKSFLIAEYQLQHASHRNEHSIAKDDSQSIERVTDAHEPHLLVVVKFQHIVTISSNIMGSTAERHEEEEAHSALKPERRIQRKGYTSQ